LIDCDSDFYSEFDWTVLVQVEVEDIADDD
jgi:hypothetical protein